MRFLKRICVVLPMVLMGLTGYGQNVSVEVEAPSAVSVGEMFNVKFSMIEEPDEFNPPAFIDFEVLAGPLMSRGKFVSIINGKTVTQNQYSYTYTLVASKAGKYTIPSATVKISGKTYSSRPFPIEVVAEAGQGSNQRGDSGSQGEGGQPEISSDDLLLRIVVSRDNVYKGQPIRVAFKLYVRNVQIAGLESAKYPAFNGFWTQEINTDNYRWQRETYKSRVYDTRILREYLLYPQQAGVLHIEQLDLTVIAQQIIQNRRRSLMDDFFSGGPEVREVRKHLVASPVKITVRELPAGAPEDFGGAVGNFTMSSDMPSGSIAANSAAAYTIKISGTGNLPLIQAPKPNLPSSFETYTTKTTESLNTGTDGIYGYRQFEYPFIARAEGEYQIPPVEFTYFNPESGKYVTLSTKNVNLEILPDSTQGATAAGALISGMSKEDIKILGQDIRFIKIGAPNLTPAGHVLMGSWLYFILIVLIIALFVLALIYMQKRIKEMRNAVLVKGKRANKVALQRLKAADAYMKAGNERQFYEEMLRALWGYMSDKLNIPVANLTRENVREELLKRNVAQESVQKYIDIISECEYAQYSPAASGQMHEVYGNAVAIISKLESVIKR